MAILTHATKATRADAASASATGSSALPHSTHGTITSALAADPTLPPSVAEQRLFPQAPAWKRAVLRWTIKEKLEEGRGKGWNWHKGAVHDSNVEPDDEELESVRTTYGYKTEAEGGPSRLYLMMLADAMLPLPRNPMSGVVSPPLLATTGIVPFSIFSTGPDIIGHYYDCIVAARREVILLTNYWQGGKNVDRIADALRELDKRQGARRAELARKEGRGNVKQAKPSIEERIIVKIMWDRGPQTLADLFRLRKPVPPGMWKTNGLPEENDVPNIHVEILNYHRPLMGTFHAKLLLVDRQVALINSNNIQDRPNIEACTRLEGDIVNSVYDHALISWGNRLNPPLPCLGTPAPRQPSDAAFTTGGESTLPVISDGQLKEMARAARAKLLEEDEESEVMSPNRRMSFTEVVDGVVRRGAPPAGLTLQTNLPAEPSVGPPSAGVEGESDAEKDNATRRAGQLWAQKVLGERFGLSPHSGATPASPTSPRTGGTGMTPPSSPSFGPRRHFAEIVEGMMKKQGIKPDLWTEGALDAFGLGPSSSRNVANEVRKSRVARGTAKDAAARGIDIPSAVHEEKPDDAETFVEPNEATAKSPKPAETAQPNGAGSSSVASTAAAERIEKGESMDPTATAEAPSASSNFPQVIDDDSDSSGLNTPALPASAAEGFEFNDGTAAEEGAPGAQAYRRKHRRTLSTVSKASASERLAQITKSLDFANLSQVKGEITAERLAAMSSAAVNGAGLTPRDGSEMGDVLDFNPFIFHAKHAPVPMALVNRRPHGTPGHSDIRNAQDAAWLAGFRYAKRHVFVQSPTLNATPIKHAILHACRRGVRVELWLGLGFNDKSESMPFQGGTNEQVVTRLYRQLRREAKGAEKHLEVYWYTGKDMTRPLNAVRKQRNCHVKYAQFDDQVAIIGSGNQDTQSWYHSQEINVMVDSREIVKEWNDGLRRNQSTHLYGRVDTDGIWRGVDGAERVDKGADPKAPKGSPSPKEEKNLPRV